MFERRNKMKRKGFTLVELLVVISIIALLMAILMPALAKVKQLAHRMVCGTNLSGIGKSMIMYSTDNHEEYPIAGPPSSKAFGTWGTTAGWQYPIAANVWTNTATITSSFYLLIKFADAQPKQFVCKGDVGSKIFKLSEAPNLDIDDLTEAWDFGPTQGPIKPGRFCSYSYNMPYYWAGPTRENYPVTTVTNPGCAVAADRNPWFDKNAQSYIIAPVTKENPHQYLGEDLTYQDPGKRSSCAAHQRDGQNVLFNDSHVKFERFPNCGVNNDNIYNYWNTKIPTQQIREIGPYHGDIQQPYGNAWHPSTEEDSVLVNETTYTTIN